MDLDITEKKLKKAGFAVRYAPPNGETLMCSETINYEDDEITLLGEPMIMVEKDGHVSIHGTRRSPQGSIEFKVDDPSEVIEKYEEVTDTK